MLGAAEEVLKERGRAKTGEVARELGLSRAYTYYLLKKLERNGIVRGIGRGRGRGRETVWVWVGTQEVQSTPWLHEIYTSVGMAISWINGLERNDWIPLPGYSEKSVGATILTGVLNTEILGRSPNKIPGSTKEIELIRRIGVDARSEIAAMGYRLAYITGDRSAEFFRRILIREFKGEGWGIRGVPDPLTTSFVLYFVYPGWHGIQDKAITAIDYLSDLRPREIYVRDPEHERLCGQHRILSLAYTAVTLLMYGRKREGIRAVRELKRAVHRNKDLLFWEDTVPEYLAKVYGEIKDRHVVTSIASLGMALSGEKKIYEKSVRYLLKEQDKRGFWKISEDIPPDPIRTGLIAFFLFHAAEHLRKGNVKE